MFFLKKTKRTGGNSYRKLRIPDVEYCVPKTVKSWIKLKRIPFGELLVHWGLISISPAHSTGEAGLQASLQECTFKSADNTTIHFQVLIMSWSSFLVSSEVRMLLPVSWPELSGLELALVDRCRRVPLPMQRMRFLNVVHISSSL